MKNIQVIDDCITLQYQNFLVKELYAPNLSALRIEYYSSKLYIQITPNFCRVVNGNINSIYHAEYVVG